MYACVGASLSPSPLFFLVFVDCDSGSRFGYLFGILLFLQSERTPNEHLVSPYLTQTSSFSSSSSSMSPLDDNLVFVMPLCDRGLYNHKVGEEQERSSLETVGKMGSAGFEAGFVERPFPCPYCPMSFKRKYTLQEHIRIHLGYRPYSCSNCGKAFTQSSSLGKHLKVCFKKVFAG